MELGFRYGRLARVPVVHVAYVPLVVRGADDAAEDGPDAQ